jgi:hypothetical protein
MQRGALWTLPVEDSHVAGVFFHLDNTTNMKEEMLLCLLVKVGQNTSASLLKTWR